MGRSKSSEGNATIFDVAERAGVSIKTVSRVFNNEPNVREKTRKKVLAAISSLNYQPSSAARGLSGKRSFTIGLIYENPHEFSYVGGVLNAALEACDREGYTLLLEPLTLPETELVEAVRQFVMQTRIDGLLLTAPLCDDAEVLAYLRAANVPVALITPDVPVSDTISIMCEDETVSCQLTDYVLGLGHEVVGFIKGHPDHSSSRKRFAGYRKALKARGIPYNASLVRQGYFDFDSGRLAAEKLLSLPKRPTAIIASNDDMAAGAFFEARERGFIVPDQLSLVGFDDTPLASHIWPPMTTVRQPIPQMADAAVRLLIQKIRGEEATIDGAEFHCEIMIRRSTISPAT